MTMATKKKRSESIIIETKTEVDCEASKTTAFKWECFQISSDKVVYKPLAEEKPVHIAVNNQPDLFVPKISFDFGFYKCFFTISMVGIEGVSGSAVGYIHVVPTNDSLTAFVEGGPRKRYKFGKNVS